MIAERTMESTNRVYEMKAETKSPNKKDKERGAEAYHERVADGVGCRRLRGVNEESDPTPGEVGATGSRLSHHSDETDGSRMVQGIPASHRQDPSPMCEHCEGRDMLLHALFMCERWVQERAELHSKVGIFNTGNFIEKLGGIIKMTRTAIKGFVHTVMNTKVELERDGAKERPFMRVLESIVQMILGLMHRDPV